MSHIIEFQFRGRLDRATPTKPPGPWRLPIMFPSPEDTDHLASIAADAAGHALTKYVMDRHRIGLVPIPPELSIRLALRSVPRTEAEAEHLPATRFADLTMAELVTIRDQIESEIRKQTWREVQGVPDPPRHPLLGCPVDF